jgi:hypothetical protein
MTVCHDLFVAVTLDRVLLSLLIQLHSNYASLKQQLGGLLISFDGGRFLDLKIRSNANLDYTH